MSLATAVLRTVSYFCFLIDVTFIIIFQKTLFCRFGTTSALFRFIFKLYNALIMASYAILARDLYSLGNHLK